MNNNFDSNSGFPVIPQTQTPTVSVNQKNNKNPKKTFIIFLALTVFTGCIGIGLGYFFGLNPTVTPENNGDNKITNPSPINIYDKPDNREKTATTIQPSAQNGNLPKIGNCTVFPSDNPWNQDISKLPVHQLSDYYISSIGLTKSLHPDFGGVSYGKSWGIPFIAVTNSQPQITVTFTAYSGESDPGPYPIPLNAPIEGEPDNTGDRHVLAVNTDTCMLYEMYRAFPTEKGWSADSGAVFNLNSNKLRPETWTSADAAGLPIFPGLVKYGEVANGSVNHAIRFTTQKTQRSYLYPARHFASSSTDPHIPPMGLRVRLKANFDTSKLPTQAKVIATAMKKYGLILADNGGDWFFQGETNKLWNDNDINSLKSIKGSDFEAVITGQ
jgi:hypothetical protein